MKKLVIIIIVILVLYVGFFGVRKYNIDPFIIEWLSSDKPKELGKDIENITDKARSVAQDTWKKAEDAVDTMKTKIENNK